MNTKRVCLLSFLAVTVIVGRGLPQSHGEKDTLYERLKKTNINKMTDREYQYFMLMKKAETGDKGKKETGKGMVSGVVTYYFNENYGEKPDVGAIVFILPEVYRDDALKVDKYLRYLRGNLRYEINLERKSMSSSDFPKLVKAVNKFMLDLKVGDVKGMTKVVADGDGSFTATLSPGKYYFVAKSAHRTRGTNADDVEILGRLDFNEAEVVADETVDIKFHF